MSIQPIILAAGKGTRMGNPDLPKVLTPLEGRPVISYLLETVSHSNFLKPVLVVGYHKEQVIAEYGDSCRYVTQEEQLGTGHAVEVCQPLLEGSAETYLVIYGDQPLWSLETMQKLLASHTESGAVLSLATVRADHEIFNAYGRIIRNEDGKIMAIREQKDCTPEEVLIDEVNPGLYCFSDAWLWQALAKVGKNNAQGEYYLTDLLGIAVQENSVISSFEVKEWRETLGINTPQQLEQLRALAFSQQAAQA